MARERTPADLLFMHETAVQKAARLERRAADEPQYGRQTRYLARLARHRAEELRKEIEGMSYKDEATGASPTPPGDWEKQNDPTTADLVELARQCDRHAKAFGDSLRRLHEGVVEARRRNGGRGISALVCWSALERASCQYFVSTPLRSLRSSPRIAGQPSFERQIEMWLPMLNAPPPNSSPLSPSPPVAA
jgi:hypothetical protein